VNNLVCPIDHSDLRFDGKDLISAHGKRYPVVEGVPVLLVPEEAQTIGVAHASIKRAHGCSDVIDERAPQLYLESLGIHEQEKEILCELHHTNTTEIDPVVVMLIGATCGNAYSDLVGTSRLREYPIPTFPLTPSKEGGKLLDVGCNWGRWSVAAARRGFHVVGLDPSLGAVMAARRVATELSLDIKYVVGDGRHLPFRDDQFDAAYSYSVLQHFSERDAYKTIAQVGRVLKPGGVARIQMANRWGIRSIQHQMRRSFRHASDFEVRYWTIKQLKDTFSEVVGSTAISADCFFGLGWQWCDFRHLTGKHKCMLFTSEVLRQASRIIRPLRLLADSVFCTAVKHRPLHGAPSNRSLI
jgi:SAM-dependent methyltransferase/uncharacterized protein YbaR (Trm112 family)